MINAFMNGLGIGLALWLVTIPTMLVVFRRSKSDIFRQSYNQNERALELMEERNKIDNQIVTAIHRVADIFESNDVEPVK